MKTHTPSPQRRFVPLGLLCAALVALWLVGCTGTPRSLPVKQELPVAPATFSFDQADYPSKDNLFPTYRIAPGDLLDILFQIKTNQSVDSFRIAIDHQITVKFINTPELNETQNVEPDGKISLPYIGQVSVVGKTLPELTQELTQRYSKVFKKPEILVLVPEFSTAIKELKQDLHTAPRGLSRLVTVRPDGYATFPLIGDVFVATKTIPEANKDIDDLFDKRMPGLHVDLFLEKTVGSTVYVMGEVRTSGAFRIERPISVFEAVALAGGHRENARLDNVVVLRRKGHEVMARRVDLSSMLSAGKDAEYFYLRPDDLVYVPTTMVASLSQLMTQLQNIIWFRGWSLSGDIFTDGIFNTQWQRSTTSTNDTTIVNDNLKAAASAASTTTSTTTAAGQ